MDIEEAFFSKEQRARVYCKYNAAMRASHRQHAILLLHSLAKFGHPPHPRAGFHRA